MRLQRAAKAGRQPALHRGKKLLLNGVSAIAMIAALLVVAPTTASAALSCTGVAYAPPHVPGGESRYGPVSSANVAFSGSPGYRKYYSVTVQGNVPRKIGVKALGFDSGGRATWYNLGISDSRISGGVPWGRVLAYPKVMVASNAAGGNVTWVC